jgi:ABC-type multidrug transport system ATPase subunit
MKLILISGKSVTAVNNITFSVEEGEIFCLLGHNGAGKTTTINMLTGLFTPSGGYATVFGNDIVTDINAVRKTMGVTPQVTATSTVMIVFTAFIVARHFMERINSS